MHISGKLIRDMKHGNEAAFDAIYMQYHKLIYYIINNYVKDAEVAKDLTQDAFIKMYNKIRITEEPKNFHPWFITLTKNIVFDHFRKNPLNLYEPNSEKTLAEFPDPSYQATPGDISFRSLTPLEKQILDYKLVFNMTFKEIAETLDMTQSVVTKLYYGMLDKLRTEMTGNQL